VTLSLRYAARSDVGLLRDLNEDSMYAGPRLLAIADGMGGHAAGEVASRVAIESVAPLDDGSPGADLIGSLRDAVESASGYLQDMVAADNALDGMGTTLTAVLFAGQRLGLVHIGDSRCYLLRDGQLAQITHDHTLVQHLVDEGRITPEEASTHPQRSWITRSLTGRGELELDLSIREVRVGDRYLLCSDGLSGPVSEETLAETLRTAPDPHAACEQLVELALRAGGPDNVSAIVADVVETDSDVGGTPIVGGAAADAPAPAPADEDTPATRAANLGPQDGRAAREATEDDSDEDADAADDDRPRRRSRLPLVIALVVLLVVLAGVGTWLYTRSQYYVGVAKGQPETVGLYRGVSGSVLGLDLASLDQRTDLPVSALPDFEQVHVRNGIDASSHNDARAIVARLRADACPTASPTPSPSATPTGKATPAPSPTPTPTPAYCHG
jgi:serine/threonine protein phosphatase PrpC